MATPTINLGGGTIIVGPHDSEKVTFAIDIPFLVKDKKKELTRRLLQALARHEFDVKAGGYEVTVRKSKK